MRYAYRYRDYVVDAFNRDLPYDQFIVEQLAGDLLPPTGDLTQMAGRGIATGFLMAGPKALAETDKEQSRLDVVDDQLDVTGRAFLGLTVGCARCHDHKFDPISQRDYYRMNAIFAGSVEREVPLVSLFDVQTASRNFPLLNQANVLKQMAGRGGRGGRGGARGGRGGAGQQN